MKIREQLTIAAEIIANYSNGSLPEPTYISVSATGMIGFQMTSVAQVQRWALSVDGTVNVSRPTSEDDNSTHYVLNFKHDDLTIQVYHIERVEEKISA